MNQTEQRHPAFYIATMIAQAQAHCVEHIFKVKKRSEAAQKAAWCVEFDRQLYDNEALGINP